ncbi:MAG: hypothetical protein QF809_04100, partial [Candidatus Peribacteraceae bacterium]|nr:hypothetical protein [Candidatus Peribacteraceae bacterium]
SVSLIMSCPRLLQPLWKIWCSFSHVLGLVMSFLILSLFWLICFSLYGIGLKIWNLKNLFKKKPDTYWIDPPKDAGMKYQF